MVEADILSTVSEPELEQAAAVLLKIKSRLLEMADQDGDETYQSDS